MQIDRSEQMMPAKLPTSHYLLCKAKRSLEPVWVGLGALESRLLHKPLKKKLIDRPLYVTGLARAGTTVTLELLSKHRDVATHRYRDMAQPYLPFIWNWMTDRLPLPAENPEQRIHQDGVLVTRESPEAVEETIWNRFFPELYEESRSAVLDGSTSHKKFEAYYKATIGKLLLAHKRSRYLSKANYNLTRLGYLVRMFPNARFVVIVRRPAAHCASWIKQHEIFLQAHGHDPRWFETIRIIGHREFGLDNRFVNAGDTQMTSAIREAWDKGEYARAFGLYWSSMYGHVLDLVDSDPLVRQAVMFVRYEDLCATPRETINAILTHAQLDIASFEQVREQYVAQLKEPAYYRAKFSEKELYQLQVATANVATRLGYEPLEIDS